MAPRIGRSRLPELLDAKRMKQTDLARILGVTDAFISQIISGKRYFSYPLSIHAADILGCLAEELHDIQYDAK